MTVIILNMTVIILTTCAVLILTVFFAAPMNVPYHKLVVKGVPNTEAHRSIQGQQ
jgi:hypothetical protein